MNAGGDHLPWGLATMGQRLLDLFTDPWKFFGVVCPTIACLVLVLFKL